MRNPELDATTQELRACGVKFSIDGDGPHVKVKWWHGGKPRMVICSKTGSDHRGALNQRALTRRILREDGFDVDSSPKPQPRTATFEKILEVPVDVETTPEKLSRIEEEVKILADLLLGIAPAFDSVLDEAETLTQRRPAKFNLTIGLSPGRLGAALAALYSAGFLPQEIDVDPVGSSAPPKIEVKAEKNGHRVKLPKGTRGFILETLKSDRLSTRGLMEKLSIPREGEKAFAQHLTILKKIGSIVSDGHGLPWRLVDSKVQSQVEAKGDLT